MKTKALLVLLLISLNSLTVRAVDWFNGFDLPASTNAWNCWWASPAASIGWTGTLDASNNPASGSIRMVAPFTGAAGEQFMIFSTFASTWSWNPGVVLDGRTYRDLICDIKVDSQTALTTNGDYGSLVIGFLGSPISSSTLAPLGAVTLSRWTTNWFRVVVPIDSTQTNLERITGIYLQMWSNGILTNTLTFFVDNVQLACNQPTGRNFYVATTGSDGDDGSSGAPFRTLQRAALIMQPGDTAWVSGGTFRETLAPARSGVASAPIAFRAYPGQHPVIHGTDPISNGWSLYSGSIYRAPMGWTCGNGYDQVFVDGQMMTQARFPNTGLDPLHPTLANLMATNTTNVVTGSALTQTTDFWKGGWIVGGFGSRWHFQSAAITSSVPGSLRIDHWSPSGQWFPLAGEPGDGLGYVFGVLGALDTTNEWHIQNGFLYLWPPFQDNFANHLIEAKRRAWCADLSNRSWIVLDGLNFLAGSVRLATNCVVQNCNAKYVSHFTLFNWQIWEDGAEQGQDGWYLNGNFNTVSNCSIDYSAGAGLVINGVSNLITRTAISDTDYSGGWSTPIRIRQGGGNRIWFNSVWNIGGDGMTAINMASADDIEYNDLSVCGLLCWDVGFFHPWGADGRGTRFAHNWVHDNRCGIVQDFGKNGIYLDSYCRNFTVDHNVVWNCPSQGICICGPASNHLLYNNTLFNCEDITTVPYDPWPAANPDTNFWTTDIFLTVRSNNLYFATNPASQLRDYANNDFRLKPGAPAIDAGVVIPVYADRYSGRAPDLGAYEFDAPPWSAGTNGRPVFPMSDQLDLAFNNFDPDPWSQPIASPFAYFYSWGGSSPAGSFTLDSSFTNSPPVDPTNGPVALRLTFDDTAYHDLVTYSNGGFGVGIGGPMYWDYDNSEFTSTNRHDYVCSFDARVEGLLPGVTNANAYFAITFLAPDDTIVPPDPGSDLDVVLGVSIPFLVSSNWTHYEFRLDQGSLTGGSSDETFARYRSSVTELDYGFTLDMPHQSFGWDGSNALILDNIALRLAAPPPEPPKIEIGTIVDWNFDDKPVWYSFPYTSCQPANTNFTAVSQYTANSWGAGGSNGWTLQFDNRALATNQSQWAIAGTGCGGPITAPLINTTNLSLYQFSFDARAGNLAPGETAAASEVQLQFLTNGQPVFGLTFSQDLKTNWNTFIYTLDYGAIQQGSLGAFAANLGSISNIVTELRAIRAADDFTFTSNNLVVADNVKLTRLAVGLPPLSLTLSNGTFIVTWSGAAQLQSSPVLQGPYTDVPCATNGCYAAPLSVATRFFRTRWILSPGP